MMDCFEFNNQIYYPGTKVKLRELRGKVVIMTFTGVRGNELTFMGHYNFSFPVEMINRYVLEIVELPREEFIMQRKKKCPPLWDVEIGWLWYIIIMTVGTLFNARWLVYIVATLYFFLWKNGKLGGKK